MIPTYYSYVYSRQKSLFGSPELLQNQLITFFFLQATVSGKSFKLSNGLQVFKLDIKASYIKLEHKISLWK